MIEKRNDWQERLSPRVNAIAPSGIRKFFDIAAQMEDVISLGVGEPDFVTPWSIRESCVYGLEQGYTSYTANRGLPELREEIAKHYQQEYDCSYDADTDILVTVGVSEALDLVMRAILAPGDEVLIPEPCYVSYLACTILAGGKPVAVPAKIEIEFRITPDELEEHVTPKTKVLLIGYPNNPTGAIMTRKDLLAIAAFAEKHDLIVISDEIYGDLTYGGEKHVCFSSLPGMQERTILLNGFSKAYAMTGWRIGYTASPLHVAKAMTNFQSHSTSHPNFIARWAALAALSGPDDQLKNMVAEFDRRRRRMVELINGIPGLSCKPPKGAFYVMMNISGLIGKKLDGVPVTGSMSFTELLLESQQVAVVPGVGFGADRYVRLSYATNMENIEKGLARIREFAASLQD